MATKRRRGSEEGIGAEDEAAKADPLEVEQGADSHEGKEPSREFTTSPAVDNLLQEIEEANRSQEEREKLEKLRQKLASTVEELGDDPVKLDAHLLRAIFNAKGNVSEEEMDRLLSRP